MWALSNSTSGPTGALSYYLGSNFKISHGIAGGVFIGKYLSLIMIMDIMTMQTY